jgi:ABC-type hemin transport system ATPase subunit
MECTIYRNDRILPIVVKEYLEEVMTNHPSWQQMPRRMLRHRVIQQCARLAFGISAQEVVNIENNLKNITEATDPIQIEKKRTKQLKEILHLKEDTYISSTP